MDEFYRNHGTDCTGNAELSLIDEDYGQLEMGAEEDQYPVTFPCVLIGNTNPTGTTSDTGHRKANPH